MTVTVLTDTTSALRQDVAARWGIRLVPLTLTVGGRPYRDGELTTAGLLASTERVTTSGPPPGEFLQALDGLAEAVIVTVAEELSSTHGSAVLAAKMTEVPVETVDSGSAAGAQALVAIAAAQCARDGGTRLDVAEAARRAAREVRLVGCLDSFDRLAAGGRVPRPAAAAVRRVGLRFMFELRSGRIRPLRPAGSSGAAAGRMARMCARGARPGTVADVMVLGEFAAELHERLTVPTGLDLTGSFGSAMLLHTGQGVTGLAWRWRPADP